MIFHVRIRACQKGEVVRNCAENSIVIPNPQCPQSLLSQNLQMHLSPFLEDLQLGEGGGRHYYYTLFSPALICISSAIHLYLAFDKVFFLNCNVGFLAPALISHHSLQLSFQKSTQHFKPYNVCSTFFTTSCPFLKPKTPLSVFYRLIVTILQKNIYPRGVWALKKTQVRNIGWSAYHVLLPFYFFPCCSFPFSS